MNIKTLHMVAFLLLVVGGLNWGLWGLFQFNLVESVLGTWSTVVTAVYVLVGVSALWLLAVHKGDCKICGGK